MAAWITKEDVEVILQTELDADTYIDGLIDHAQALAELEIGTQDSPNSKIKAVLANIVGRMWQAGQSARMNPAGMQSQTTGPFNYQDPNAGVAGLGLTNREKADLRKAAGINPGMWVQPTTRGLGLETAPYCRPGIPDPASLVDVVGGEPAVYDDGFGEL